MGWLFFAILILLVALCLWFVLDLRNGIPKLFELYRWHMNLNKTEWVLRGIGYCGECRHAKIKRNSNVGPYQPKHRWFCLYYWCYLSYSNINESPNQCKACNKGLIQRDDIPVYSECDE